MARRDTLLRLHESLTTRRSELFKRLGIELRDLGYTKDANGTGDTADAAFGSDSESLASSLAELEAKELMQIERALNRMKQGKYGRCEVCASRIPVDRLNALPYSTLCVPCQRDVERGVSLRYRNSADWDKVRDSSDDREVNLSALELDLSKG